MTTLMDSKLTQLQNVYYVVGVVEEDGDNHVLIDLFPGGPGPVLRVAKDSVTVEATDLPVDATEESTATLSKIYIAKNVAVTMIQPAELTDHPLSLLAPSFTNAPAAELSTADIGAAIEPEGTDEIFGGLTCLVWKTNPLYWQLVAALKVAKSTGAIRNEGSCKQAASNIEDLVIKLGMPSFLTKLIGGSMAKCACKHVF